MTKKEGRPPVPPKVLRPPSKSGGKKPKSGPSPETLVSRISRQLTGFTRPRGQKAQAPIVPAQNVAGRALIFVIAIMTFLSCLTLGAVTLVRDTASTWQSQISREATIQIRNTGTQNIEDALRDARDLALTFEGVRNATIVDREATARLLEPWLGSGLDIDELPVPRLVIVTIDETDPPDFSAMRETLTSAIANLSLDDHRAWVDRLVEMARSTVLVGTAILILMLCATVMTVVFATRGAMAGNGHIIDVLHFVGAEARFIALEFGRHFLLVGLKGAAVGGALALLVFLAFGWWMAASMATPGADQASAFFGNFAIGLAGYLGVGAIVLAIAVMTAATSHITVVTHLGEIESAASDNL